MATAPVRFGISRAFSTKKRRGRFRPGFCTAARNTAPGFYPDNSRLPLCMGWSKRLDVVHNEEAFGVLWCHGTTTQAEDSCGGGEGDGCTVFPEL